MSDSPSDQDLVGRVRDDRNAFLDLVEDLRVELFGYCRSLTGDPFDAEDLAQETLLRAFWRMTSEPGIENPRAYLFRTATHAFIDERRRVPRRGVPEELTEIPAPEAPPAVEVRDAMEKAARVLAPRERAVLLLKDVFAFTLAEAAGFLETTVGAVKAALHRARTKIRDDRVADRRAGAHERAPVQAGVSSLRDATRSSAASRRGATVAQPKRRARSARRSAMSLTGESRDDSSRFARSSTLPS